MTATSSDAMANDAAAPQGRPGILARLLPPHEPLEARRRLFLLTITLPVVLYVFVCSVIPTLQGLFFSLYRYNLLKPHRNAFVGFDNFARLWSDSSTHAAIVNTLVFTGSAVALEFVIGFALALLLWRDSLFNRISLALMLVPVAVTPLATGLIFRGLLTPDYGPIGYWARTLGISAERGFLGTPETALATIVAMDVWQWTPLMALILLAGLKAIPASVLEAAEMDGATTLQRFFTVVLPLMVPTILLALILRMIDATMVFDTIYVTTNGGPNDATNVLMIAAVKQGLEFFNVGKAGAISALMLAMVAVMANLFFLAINRYDRKVAP
ncbi:Trehalose transport system permease protein SugA [Hartmannibacter diazotrophicus]|uniref:Trehalose transport system permease protein SugA n=1 Tax=Hartmannibacter diazotrophicus TaxID=1482074 RepID=A0A2C9DE83_9HYPH|nr:sugar ABC transporter permease [Hartmannibacter diazotrophicus]SON58035.1 Trehalose transport system permease protein SugA [Hartmannibacter diazotrophicus]